MGEVDRQRPDDDEAPEEETEFVETGRFTIVTGFDALGDPHIAIFHGGFDEATLIGQLTTALDLLRHQRLNKWSMGQS